MRANNGARNFMRPLLEVMIADAGDEFSKDDRVGIQAGLDLARDQGTVLMEEELSGFGLTWPTSGK
jgi:hypothetical protein